MKNTCKFRVGTVLLGAALTWGAGSVSAQSNQLLNPSFETGDTTLGWAGIANWNPGAYTGGFLTTNDAHQGTNVMAMFAYGSGNRLLEQRFAVTPGQLFEVDGWLRTPAGGQWSDILDPIYPRRVVDSGQCRHVPRDLHLCRRGRCHNGRLGLL